MQVYVYDPAPKGSSHTAVPAGAAPDSGHWS